MYTEDLATIHHAGFSRFAAEAAPGLLAELQKAGIARGLVVDLGCGSGVWLRELHRAGYDGWGLDPSAAMLRIARETAPAATFRVGGIAEARLPRCDAVTAIGEVFSYRPTRTARRFTLRDGLRKVAGVLRPGGLLLFDVLVTAGGTPMRYRACQAGETWAVLVDVQEDQRRRLLRREIQTFRRVGGQYRRGREQHWLDVFARREVERQLRERGFTVRASRRYGHAELPPRRLAFIARKRER